MDEITIKVTDTALSTAVAFFVGGALAWLAGWPSRRAAKRREAQEHAARVKAEAELAAIENRGDAPHFFASKARFNHLYVHGEKPGAVSFVPAGSPHLLCYCREEVERALPEGRLVFLVLSNAGKDPKTMRVQLEGESLICGFEPDIDDAEGKQYLAYPYKPALHGKFQELTFRFEMPSGRQALHKYGTWHGITKLVRIDPE